MSEWVTALIAAGSALAGGVVTGWYARSAGLRQAEAARHAGDRQADALLETVRLSLEEQRTARGLDLRRQTYARFIEAGEAVVLSRGSGGGTVDDALALRRAFGAVLLEGPAEVTDAARRFVESVRGSRPLDDLERARTDFIAAARHALGIPADL
ncbi:MULTISPECIES: hypothetical protein [unclassified Streptomyces]|uniref:hypothetical protein n=1 Tax=unclassified Streptomyces TaxID=2593676 RepID=UPI00382D51BF